MLKTSSSGQGSQGSQSALASLEKRLTGRDPDDSDVPVSVRRGARLMLAGGGLTLLIGLFLTIVTIADKNALTDSSGKKLSNGAFTSNLVGLIISYVIVVAIWVLMARMNRSGQNWARILASVFCAISTWETFGYVNSLTSNETFSVAGIIYIVFNIVLWAVGVIAIAMVWRGESNAYFRERSARRQAG
jgi:membrane-bound metal-dependent hydrolase YbcI (DUF457 family)